MAPLRCAGQQRLSGATAELAGFGFKCLCRPRAPPTCWVQPCIITGMANWWQCGGRGAGRGVAKAGKSFRMVGKMRRSMQRMRT